MNTKTNDGGPAFPTYHHDILPEIGPHVRETLSGMTLRDYFAAEAMQGLSANSCCYHWTVEQTAVFAYKQADAMLVARNKEKE